VLTRAGGKVPIVVTGPLQQENDVEYDLSGPNGNAMAIMGNVQRWAKQLKVDPDPILEDMRSGDYDHLIEVVEKHFGHVVTFVGGSNDP